MTSLTFQVDENDQSTVSYDPLTKPHGVYVTVHGHFYQPPRENPYLDAIERQPSATPFHDWNERIHWECYRPNAFARVLNDRGELLGIVNNYEYMSFNIGPTLMSWLERYDMEVYQRILEADIRSSQRLNGQIANPAVMNTTNSPHSKKCAAREIGMKTSKVRKMIFLVDIILVVSWLVSIVTQLSYNLIYAM